MDVLKDRPELDAIAGHEREGALDRRQAPEGGEFVEKVEDRPRRRPRELGEALRHQEAQPARIGRQPIRRQDEKDRGRPFLEIGETKIRAAHDGGHAP